MSTLGSSELPKGSEKPDVLISVFQANKVEQKSDDNIMVSFEKSECCCYNTPGSKQPALRPRRPGMDFEGS